MKKNLFIFGALIAMSPLCAQNFTYELPKLTDPAAMAANEIAMLDDLIAVTEQNLEKQKKIKILVVEYQKIQSVYLQNTENKEMLFRMIKSAYRLLESIKDAHLTQAFDPKFISELNLLSQIAAKSGIAKP